MKFRKMAEISGNLPLFAKNAILSENGLQRAPRRVQKSSKIVQNGVLGPLWDFLFFLMLLGAIFDGFLTILGPILDGFLMISGLFGDVFLIIV